MSDPRILIYGMNFSPELTGVGKFTGELADFLAMPGGTLTVITAPPHYPGWAVLPPYRNRYSIERGGDRFVYRCPLLLRRRMGGIWRLIAPWSFAVASAPVAFWQIVRRRPKVVICVEPTLMVAPVALIAARLAGARTVLHVQDLEVDAAFQVGHLKGGGVISRIAYGIERFLLRRFDHIVSISNAMIARLAAKGCAPDRLALIRNWVDTSEIRPLDAVSPYRAELDIGASDFVILYSGNIGAKQGLDVLLDAAGHTAAVTGLRFVVAGEGPEKAPLMERYGALPNVTFLPLQPRERFNDFLNLADAHVVVQRADAADLVLPSKIAAMLASGKTVVATAAEGTELAEFLRDDAVVIPPDQPAALAAALVDLSRLPVGARPRAGRAILSQLSAGAAAQAFRQLAEDRT